MGRRPRLEAHLTVDELERHYWAASFSCSIEPAGQTGHTSVRLRVPQHVRLLFLPAYSDTAWRRRTIARRYGERRAEAVARSPTELEASKYTVYNGAHRQTLASEEGNHER